MKYVLTIVLIILMIGIYTYAHVNRYQIFTIFDARVPIKYDNWTDRTFRLFYSKGIWIELGKQEKEKLKE